MDHLNNDFSKFNIVSDFDGTKLVADVTTLTGETERLTLTWNEFRQGIYETSVASDSVGKITASITNATKQLGAFIGRYVSLNEMFQLFRKGVGYVKELDSKLNEFKMVTDSSTAAMSSFAEEAANIASEVASTTATITDSATEWARLGYSARDALDLASSAAKLATAGFMDTEAATTHLTSSLSAFYSQDINNNLISTADAAEQLTDKMIRVGNTLPISAAGIGEGLERAAGTLFQASNSVDESIALLASANATIQNPQRVGTAFQTVAMRLRGTKASDISSAIDDADLDLTGMSEDASKLYATIKKLTAVKSNDFQGISILTDTGAYKSTFSILRDIGEVWAEMNDASQAALTEEIAGKRQAAIVSALLNNTKLMDKALTESQNSAGATDKAMVTALNSIEAKTTQLQQSWQKLWQDFIDSDTIKTVVDMLNNLVKALDRIITSTSKLGGTPAIFSAILGGFGAKQSFGKTGGLLDFSKMFKKPIIGYEDADGFGGALFNTLDAAASKGSLNNVENLNKALAASYKAVGLSAEDTERYIQKFNDAVSNSGKEADDYIASQRIMGSNLANIKNGFKGFGTILGDIAKSFAIGAAEMAAFWLATKGIEFAIRKFDEYAHRYDIAIEKSREFSEQQQKEIDSVNENLNALDDLSSRFEKLSSGVDDRGHNISLSAEEYDEYRTIVAKLIDISPQIVKGFDDEKNAIIDKTTAIQEATAAQKEYYAQILEQNTGANGTRLTFDAAGALLANAEKETREKTTKSSVNGVEFDNNIIGKLLRALYTTQLSQSGQFVETFEAEVDKSFEPRLKELYEASKQYEESKQSFNEWLNDNIQGLDGDVDSKKFFQRNIDLISQMSYYLENKLTHSSNVTAEAWSSMLTEVENANQVFQNSRDAVEQANAQLQNYFKEFSELSAHNAETREGLNPLNSSSQRILDSFVSSLDISNYINEDNTRNEEAINSTKSAIDEFIRYLSKSQSQIETVVSSINDSLSPEEYENSVDSFVDTIISSAPEDIKLDPAEVKAAFNFYPTGSDGGELTPTKMRDELNDIIVKNGKRALSDGLDVGTIKLYYNVAAEMKNNGRVADISETSLRLARLRTDVLQSVDSESVQSIDEIREAVEQYSTAITNVNKLVKNNTTLTGEDYNAILSLVSGNRALTATLEQIVEYDEEKEKATVKDYKALQQLIKDTKGTSSATRDLNKVQSAAVDQYNDLVSELIDVTSGTENLDNATRDHVSTLLSQIDNVRALINEYSLLEQQLLGSASAFDKYSEAQSKDAQNNYGDQVVQMLKDLGEGISSDDGSGRAKIGTATFQAAFEALVPDRFEGSVVERTSEAIKDLLKRGFISASDDAPEITGKNIEKIIEAGLSNGAFEGTIDEFSVKGQQSLDDLAEKFQITPSLMFAFITEISKYSESGSLLFSELYSEAEKLVSGLVDIKNAGADLSDQDYANSLSQFDNSNFTVAIQNATDDLADFAKQRAALIDENGNITNLDEWNRLTAEIHNSEDAMVALDAVMLDAVRNQEAQKTKAEELATALSDAQKKADHATSEKDYDEAIKQVSELEQELVVVETMLERAGEVTQDQLSGAVRALNRELENADTEAAKEAIQAEIDEYTVNFSTDKTEIEEAFDRLQGIEDLSGEIFNNLANRYDDIINRIQTVLDSTDEFLKTSEFQGISKEVYEEGAKRRQSNKTEGSQESDKERNDLIAALNSLQEAISTYRPFENDKLNIDAHELNNGELKNSVDLLTKQLQSLESAVSLIPEKQQITDQYNPVGEIQNIGTPKVLSDYEAEDLTVQLKTIIDDSDISSTYNDAKNNLEQESISNPVVITPIFAPPSVDSVLNDAISSANEQFNAVNSKPAVEETQKLVNAEKDVATTADQTANSVNTSLNSVSTEKVQSEFRDAEVAANLLKKAGDGITSSFDFAVRKISELGEAISKVQMPNWTGSIGNIGTVSSGKAKAYGTASANGRNNDLVGELGREMVVDPHSGTYYTVGDTGAEMVDLPKDAIVFNHKQTEELLKNGKTSRGKAFAFGSEPVSGNAFKGGTRTNSATISPWATSSNNSSSTSKADNAKAAEESSKEWIEKFKEAAEKITKAFEESFLDISDTAKNISSEVSSTISDDVLEAFVKYKNDLSDLDELGFDLDDTKFGNIDLDNRQIIEWTEELVDEYRDVLDSLGIEIEDLPGKISTVLGARSNYEDIEISYSPILQTAEGPKLLSQDTVDRYIYGLIEKARDSLGDWQSEDLIALDVAGLEIDGQHIQQLLAGVEESALRADEAMHYLGADGSINLNLRTISEAAAAAGMSLAEYQEVLQQTIDTEARATRYEYDISAREAYYDQLVSLYEEYYENYGRASEENAKQLHDAWTSIYEDQKSTLETAYSNMEMTTRSYLQNMMILFQQFYNRVDGYARESADAQKNYIRTVKDAYERMFSAASSLIGNQISQLQDQMNAQVKALQAAKKAAVAPIEAAIKAIDNQIYEYQQMIYGLQDQIWEIDQQIKALKKQQKPYEKAIKANEKQIKNNNKIIKGYQKEQKVLEEQIDANNDLIDAIEKANDERQRAIDLQKAQYNLERAQNQKTQRVYSAENGFTYQSDPNAIREARTELDNQMVEQRKSEIEKQNDAIQTQIDLIQDQIEVIEKRNEALEEENERLQEEIDKIQEQIDVLEEQKEAIQEVIDLYQHQIELLNRQKEALEREKQAIEEYYDAMIEATQEFYEQQIEALEKIQKELEKLTNMKELAESLDLLETFGYSLEDLLNADTGTLDDMKNKYAAIVATLYQGSPVIDIWEELFGFPIAGLATDYQTLAQNLGLFAKTGLQLDSDVATPAKNANDNLKNLVTSAKDLDNAGKGGGTTTLATDVKDIASADSTSIGNIATSVKDIATSDTGTIQALSEMIKNFDGANADALQKLIDFISSIKEFDATTITTLFEKIAEIKDLESKALEGIATALESIGKVAADGKTIELLTKIADLKGMSADVFDSMSSSLTSISGLQMDQTVVSFLDSLRHLKENSGKILQEVATGIQQIIANSTNYQALTAIAQALDIIAKADPEHIGDFAPAFTAMIEPANQLNPVLQLLSQYIDTISKADIAHLAEDFNLLVSSIESINQVTAALQLMADAFTSIENSAAIFDPENADGMLAKFTAFKDGMLTAAQELNDGIIKLFGSSGGEGEGENGEGEKGGGKTGPEGEGEGEGEGPGGKWFSELVKAIDELAEHTATKIQEMIDEWTRLRDEMMAIIGVESSEGGGDGGAVGAESGDSIIGVLNDAVPLIEEAFQLWLEAFNRFAFEGDNSIQGICGKIVEIVKKMVEEVIDLCEKAKQALDELLEHAQAVAASISSIMSGIGASIAKAGEWHGTAVIDAVPAFATGTAYANGNWGLRNDVPHPSKGVLVGEIGPELVVRDDNYFTVGDHGAEMRKDLRPNDIIFNAAQTQAIFKYGKIGTRGKAYANGNAGNLPNFMPSAMPDWMDKFIGIVKNIDINIAKMIPTPNHPNLAYATAGGNVLNNQGGDNLHIDNVNVTMPNFNSTNSDGFVKDLKNKALQRFSRR